MIVVGIERREIGEGDLQLLGREFFVRVVERRLRDVEQAIAEATLVLEGLARFIAERESEAIEKSFDPRHGERLRLGAE